MRSGDSANTPELPPKAKPAAANGLCQPETTSYGLGPTGPGSCAVADPANEPASSNATAAVQCRMISNLPRPGRSGPPLVSRKSVSPPRARDAAEYTQAVPPARHRVMPGAAALTAVSGITGRSAGPPRRGRVSAP